MKKIAVCFLCFLCSCSIGIAQQFNYGEALQKSIIFYETQQSGKLPEWNRVSWRGDSGLDHGKDVGLDLTGGWYDAGDHVKFNFPMASSVTMLAWGGIEYKAEYEASGQMVHLKQNLKFVLDYMLRCHTGPTELYIQIGDGNKDHAYWGSAEVFPFERESFKIDQDKPGSDISAEFAAAFAASSILFKDSDPAFSATLIDHAEELYEFADRYRAVYSTSNSAASPFYTSVSGYKDELVWGAAWLYRATNKNEYLVKAEQAYTEVAGNVGYAHSWDDKSYGSYVLLAQLTGKNTYINDAKNHLDFWSVGYNGERVTYTPGGQAWLVEWGSLRYVATTSFLALVFADKVDMSATLKERYRDFAKSQVDYALGNNPINRSFMAGFGNNPVNDPHHRGNHGSWDGSADGSPSVPSHVLYGALVGGPRLPNDQFVDNRKDFVANEVATDYNAGFTGALAALYGKYGGDPIPGFKVDETPTRDEITSSVVYYFIGEKKYNPNIRFENKTAWPARATDKLTARYFFNISEAMSQGFSINDFEASGENVTIKEWDANNGIYYAEVSLVGQTLIPNSNQNYKKEVNLTIGTTRNNVPFDPSNDWSAKDISEGGGHQLSPNIPVYDNGVLVFGNEPSGGTLGVDSFSALGISLAPNPATTSFSIAGSKLQGGVLKVVSLAGSVLKNVTIPDNTFDMNVSDLAEGLYVIQVQTVSGALATHKLAIAQ